MHATYARPHQMKGEFWACHPECLAIFSGCRTADTQTNEGQHQLYKNQIISKLALLHRFACKPRIQGPRWKIVDRQTLRLFSPLVIFASAGATVSRTTKAPHQRKYMRSFVSNVLFAQHRLNRRLHLLQSRSFSVSNYAASALKSHKFHEARQRLAELRSKNFPAPKGSTAGTK